MTKKLLMGNEAMAHAALEAGVRVVAGYPGTPSSEIVETIAKLHAQGSAQGVHVEWSTNEKVALEMLFGASLGGARCLFTCKQMGLNVASDALMSLNYVSVRGGLVLVVADDPGPISSQTEQDTRRFAAFAKVPVLDPSTPEQAFAMVKAAFDLSERFGTPVIVRPTTRVDHASAFFDVEDQTVAREVPEAGFERDTSKWVIFPRRAFQAHGEINERLASIAEVFSDEEPYKAFNPLHTSAEGDARGAAFGIVAGGISAAYAREALRIVEQRTAEAGIELPPYRFMQVGTPYPFPVGAMRAFVSGLSDVLVVEELDYVLEDELLRLAGRDHLPLTVHGKMTDEMRARGENDVDDIAAHIERFLGLSGRLRRYRREQVEHSSYASPIEYDAADALPVRPPVLCPGCPHRGSFYAIKQALRKTPAVMCGDIGCYTLGNAQPLDAVDTCLCMGAGVTMAQGLSLVDPQKKAIAYIGDSTFFASGMPGLANAAYNGHDITVMVLDNATTAMTGSQPHPGTGITLMGGQSEPLSIEAVLVANGFKHVYHANPLDKDASIVAAKAAIAFEGPSAVIFESPCIQLITPDEPVTIDPATCTGCKKCVTDLGCPGISFDPSIEGPRSGDRGQAYIDPSLCNGCDLCVQVCPSKAISYPLPDAEFLNVSEDAVFTVVEGGEAGPVAAGLQGAAAFEPIDAASFGDADLTVPLDPIALGEDGGEADAEAGSQQAGSAGDIGEGVQDDEQVRVEADDSPACDEEAAGEPAEADEFAEDGASSELVDLDGDAVDESAVTRRLEFTSDEGVAAGEFEAAGEAEGDAEDEAEGPKAEVASGLPEAAGSGSEADEPADAEPEAGGPWADEPEVDESAVTRRLEYVAEDDAAAGEPELEAAASWASDSEEGDLEANEPELGDPEASEPGADEPEVDESAVTRRLELPIGEGDIAGEPALEAEVDESAVTRRLDLSELNEALGKGGQDD